MVRLMTAFFPKNDGVIRKKDTICRVPGQSEIRNHRFVLHVIGCVGPCEFDFVRGHSQKGALVPCP